MEKTKYSIRVFIDKRTSHVMIRVRWSTTNEVAFTLSSRAEESKWNNDRQRAISGTVHTFPKFDELYSAKCINTEIADMLEIIDNTFVEFALRSEKPSKGTLKEVVEQKLRELTPQKEKIVKYSIDELFEQFMAVASDERNWAKSVHHKYMQMWNQIHAADKFLTLESLTKEKMNEIKNTFIKNGYSNVTTIKQFRIFHSFLNWVKEQGYELNPGVLEYKPNLKKVSRTVTCLMYDELMQFYNFQFPEEKKHLERARDMFCFMAFTSLRISDLQGLRPSNIVGDTLVLCTVKTTDKISIPLIAPAKELIAKYANTKTRKGTIFPVISDQKMNDELKEAAKLAGLDREVMQEQYYGNVRSCEVYKFHEQISCHDARRTFVCCSLAMGIPTTVVMSCTGHSSYETMKPYIDVAGSTQRTELDKWNQKYKDTSETDELKSKIDKATPAQLEVIRRALAAIQQ